MQLGSHDKEASLLPANLSILPSSKPRKRASIFLCFLIYYSSSCNLSSYTRVKRKKKRNEEKKRIRAREEIEVKNFFSTGNLCNLKEEYFFSEQYLKTSIILRMNLQNLV